MTKKYPDRRGLVYTKQIAIRVEPELWDEFELLKRNIKTDIPEAQRIVLRELVKQLKAQSESEAS